MMNLLMVDDDDVDVMVVKRMIGQRRLDFQVCRARDGIEGLRLLKSTAQTEDSPGLVLLDLNMPRMNGVDFLRKLREQDSYKDVPVIVLSSSADDDDRRATAELSANAYLIKSEIAEYPELLATTMETLCGITSEVALFKF